MNKKFKIMLLVLFLSLLTACSTSKNIETENHNIDMNFCRF
ncbi:hypothetical protein [Anaerosphaera multitolerans]|nr:hypothetical protein [Anaerosphaera multitolerans]